MPPAAAPPLLHSAPCSSPLVVSLGLSLAQKPSTHLSTLTSSPDQQDKIISTAPTRTLNPSKQTPTRQSQTQIHTHTRTVTLTFPSTQTPHTAPRAEAETDQLRALRGIHGIVPCAFSSPLRVQQQRQHTALTIAHHRIADMPSPSPASSRKPSSPLLSRGKTTTTTMKVHATGTSSLVYLVLPTSSWTQTSTSRHSRVSSSSFLAPESIVPGSDKVRTRPETTHSLVKSGPSSLTTVATSTSISTHIPDSSSNHQPSSNTASPLPHPPTPPLNTAHHTSPSVPPAYTALLALFITLGLLWAVLVWLVNFPPASWEWSLPWSWPGWGRVSRGSVRWVRRWNGRDGAGGKGVGRPVDELSRYADRHSPLDSRARNSNSGDISTPSENAVEAPRALASGVYASAAQILTRRRRLSTSKAATATSSDTPHASSTIPSRPASAHIKATVPFSRRDGNDTTQTPESAVNPYLLAPPSSSRTAPTTPKHKSSSEWLAARSAFFDGPQARSPQHAESADESVRGARMLGDLEAGTAPDCLALSRASSSSASSAVSVRAGGVLREKKGSWVDSGLAMVDGAVGRVVERMARWTDDVDGRENEGLVLPLARD